MSGYYKALRYHRYVNRMDYVFHSAAMLLDGSYRETGMYMKEIAMRGDQGHVFKRRDGN